MAGQQPTEIWPFRAYKTIWFPSGGYVRGGVRLTSHVGGSNSFPNKQNMFRLFSETTFSQDACMVYLPAFIIQIHNPMGFVQISEDFTLRLIDFLGTAEMSWPA